MIIVIIIIVITTYSCLLSSSTSVAWSALQHMEDSVRLRITTIHAAADQVSFISTLILFFDIFHLCPKFLWILHDIRLVHKMI
jgi:hypothetical protein